MLFNDQQYGILLTDLGRIYYLILLLSGCMACTRRAQTATGSLDVGPL